MISFTNPGEIDVRLISTFGANVKESDNPIGFFGTGLKYALSVLLRTNHKVTIWSGTSRLDIVIREERIRDKPFKMVCSENDVGHINSLGFTTHLGANWELWMAYRELSCNTMDEGGREMRGPVEPREGRTTVWVTGDGFEQVFAERDLIILRDEPSVRNQFANVHRGSSEYLFYKGVRAMKLEKKSLYTYNLMSETTLTEDRTVKFAFMVPNQISWSVAVCDDRQIIEQVVTAPDHTWEHDLSFSSVPKSSIAFVEVLDDLVKNQVTSVNKTAVNLWAKSTGRPILPEIHQMTKVQRVSLDRAVAFCKKIGFEVDKYPIHVVKNLGGRGLGLASNKMIFVAVKAFDLGGAKQVAAVLIEEFIHLSMDYNDLTYEMQNFLFERLVSIGEECVGEPL